MYHRSNPRVVKRVTAQRLLAIAEDQHACRTYDLVLPGAVLSGRLGALAILRGAESQGDEFIRIRLAIPTVDSRGRRHDETLELFYRREQEVSVMGRQLIQERTEESTAEAPEYRWVEDPHLAGGDPAVLVLRENGFLSKVARLQQLAADAGHQQLPVEKLADYEALVEGDTHDSCMLVPASVYRVPSITLQFAGGWQLAAVVRPTELDGVNTVNRAPSLGEELSIPERFWGETNPRLCEHCDTSRNRKATFVLLSETGEWKQVGRTCLAGFLGVDVESALAYFDYLCKVREYDEDAELRAAAEASGRPSVRRWVTVAEAVIAEHGFVSKAQTQYGGVPTAQQVDEALFLLGVKARDLKQQKRLDSLLPNGITDAAIERAEEALAWAASFDLADSTDFQRSLRTLGILADARLPERQDGIATYLPEAYRRFVEGEVERAARATLDAESGWVGAVGDRITIDAEVAFHREIEGFYGTTWLYKFRDDSGNLFVWFASRGQRVEAGQRVQLTATVKKHDEYKGVKQTAVTRGRLSVIPQDQEA